MQAQYPHACTTWCSMYLLTFWNTAVPSKPTESTCKYWSSIFHLGLGITIFFYGVMHDIMYSSTFLIVSATELSFTAFFFNIYIFSFYEKTHVIRDENICHTYPNYEALACFVIVLMYIFYMLTTKGLHYTTRIIYNIWQACTLQIFYQQKPTKVEFYDWKLIHLLKGTY